MKPQYALFFAILAAGIAYQKAEATPLIPDADLKRSGSNRSTKSSQPWRTRLSNFFLGPIRRAAKFLSDTVRRGKNHEQSNVVKHVTEVAKDYFPCFARRTSPENVQLVSKTCQNITNGDLGLACNLIATFVAKKMKKIWECYDTTESPEDKARCYETTKLYLAHPFNYFTFLEGGTNVHIRPRNILESKDPIQSENPYNIITNEIYNSSMDSVALAGIIGLTEQHTSYRGRRRFGLFSIFRRRKIYTRSRIPDVISDDLQNWVSMKIKTPPHPDPLAVRHLKQMLLSGYKCPASLGLSKTQKVMIDQKVQTLGQKQLVYVAFEVFVGMLHDFSSCNQQQGDQDETCALLEMYESAFSNKRSQQNKSSGTTKATIGASTDIDVQPSGDFDLIDLSDPEPGIDSEDISLKFELPITLEAKAMASTMATIAINSSRWYMRLFRLILVDKFIARSVGQYFSGLLESFGLSKESYRAGGLLENKEVGPQIIFFMRHTFALLTGLTEYSVSIGIVCQAFLKQLKKRSKQTSDEGRRPAQTEESTVLERQTDNVDLLSQLDSNESPIIDNSASMVQTTVKSPEALMRLTRDLGASIDFESAKKIMIWMRITEQLLTAIFVVMVGAMLGPLPLFFGLMISVFIIFLQTLRMWDEILSPPNFKDDVKTAARKIKGFVDNLVN